MGMLRDCLVSYVSSLGKGVSCVSVPSMYASDAERATKIPKSGAIRSDKSQPIIGMPPIPATMIEHTKITISQRMYVPHPIFPIVLMISPKAKALPKLFFLSMLTIAIDNMIARKNASNIPTINSEPAKTQLTVGNKD